MPKSIPPGNQNLGNNYIGAAQLPSYSIGLLADASRTSAHCA